MNQVSSKTSGKSVWAAVLKRAAVTAIAAMGLTAGHAYAGDLRIGVGIDISVPPPPVVVVHEPVVVVHEPVVVIHDDWLVGYRRALYDADLHLRVAQAAEFRANEALEAARHREGDAALVLDDADRAIADVRHELADREAAIGAARAQVEAAERDVAGARAALDAAARKSEGLKVELDLVHQRGGNELSIGAVFHQSSARTEAAKADLEVAQLHLEEVRRAGAPSFAGLEDARARLAAVSERHPVLEAELGRCHEEVYVARRRLTEATDEVALALHERDEALWLCHRDEILVGRFDPVACGFSIDIGLFNAHRRDPEWLHSYCVHDVGYWRERPAEIGVRIEFGDRVGDIGRCREVARVHDVVRVRDVEKFEVSVNIESRRKVYESVKVEREVYVKETTERTVAVREGRKPQVTQFVSRPTNVTNVTNITNVTNVKNKGAISEKEAAHLRATARAAENDKAAAESQLKKEDKQLKTANATNTEQRKELRADNKELAAVKADDAKKTATLKKEDGQLKEANAKVAEDDRAARMARRAAAAKADEPAASKADAGKKPEATASKTPEAPTGRSGRHAADPAPTPAPTGKRGRDADPTPTTDIRSSRDAHQSSARSDRTASTNDGGR